MPCRSGQTCAVGFVLKSRSRLKDDVVALDLSRPLGFGVGFADSEIAKKMMRCEHKTKTERVGEREKEKDRERTSEEREREKKNEEDN